MIKHEIIVLKNAHQQQFFNLLKLLFVFLLFVSSNNCYAFENKSVSGDLITLNVRNKTIREVFSEIEKQSDYVFFYSPNILDANKKVSINVKSQPIGKVLDKILKNMDCTYSFSGKQIFIKRGKVQRSEKKEKTESIPKRHGRPLTGNVVDDVTGETLIGVSIRIKGTQSGVVTDMNGNFTLNGITPKSELEVSYIGYKPQTLMVGDLAVINVKLTPSNEQLGEVVVVGAGTQRRISVTGAITAIRGDDLKAPSSSLTDALAGKLAGVISMTTSGEPGSTSQFYIRGVSTFGGRATPLILLDDVEITADDLNHIPPETIQSVSVLKDASATAIYGARGANGVMLITTKEGTENSRTEIHVTVEDSYLHPVKEVQYADGVTYMKMYNEALHSRTPDATPRYSQSTIDNTKNHVNPYVFPDVNWYNLIFKKGCYDQRANINVQGGGNRETYYMSLQANHNSGLLNIPQHYSLKNNINDYEYIFQNNISYKLTSSTKLELHVNAQIGNSKGPNETTSDILYQTWNVDPVSFPAYYPAQSGDTHIRFGNSILSGSTLYTNPYAYMLNTFLENNYSTLNSSLHINQDLDFITKGLNISALVNWKSYSQTYYSESITPYYYRVVDGSWDANKPSQYQLESVGPAGTDYISQSNITRNNNNTFYLDARINYKRRFGGNDLSAMLMYMMREYRDNVLPNRNQGFSGRFTYSYEDKYLAEINFGYNGTERLAKGHRFEFFPAASLGWVISSEKFWEPLENVINFMKLRGSYGLMGSDETGEDAGAAHFLYRDQITIGGSSDYHTGSRLSNSIDKSGPGFNGWAVEDAHWEREKELDLGADINIFNQFDIVLDYFHGIRDRILLKRGSWPDLMGYWGATPWSNIGKVDNKGFDLALNWKKNFTKDFHFELRANLTYNKNKYLSVDDPDYPYVWQSTTGKPLSRLTGYVAEGLFKDEQDIALSPDQTSLGSTPMPGDIKYRDINGDGKITSEDQVMISSYGSVPRIQYGFGVSFNWKHTDFGVFFNGDVKRSIMINGLDPFNTQIGHGNRNVMKFIANNYWSESNPNPNAEYPRLGLVESQINNNIQPSTYWQRNGNFLRWKTLEIGYSFPHCRFYISGDNLAIWSPFKLWDPELSWNSYPLQRTFNIGAQVKF
jgi:TonB-linked SusC/RagA family outer membrane protein